MSLSGHPASCSSVRGVKNKSGEWIFVQSLKHLSTEQSDAIYSNLDISNAHDILILLNEADRTVPTMVGQVLPAIAQAVEMIVSAMKQGGRLIYMGAGSSGRLGVLDAAECPPTFGTPPEQVLGLIAGGRSSMFRAVEDAEDQFDSALTDLQSVQLTESDVVVGITASGRTPYVMGGLSYARQLGSPTIALSCNVNADVSPLADVAIEVDTGPEVVMGSTRLKAGTAEKLIVNMLSTAAMIQLGKVYRNLMVDLKVTNEKLKERAIRIIMMAASVDNASAERLLLDADGHVKTAIVMARMGVDKDTAGHLLTEAEGYLRKVLNEDLHGSV